MQDKIIQILQQYWGYSSFRSMQENIILSVLEGRDTLALLPTGGGKSICFQVPALAKEGVCLVISPLIALMKDQVDNLIRRGIKAAAIYSGMSQEQIENTTSNVLFDKEYKFLYVSPERLKTDTFRANFPRLNLNLIAVDEAHCISQWGYDFRPPYLEIAEIREHFKNTPVLALTATATSDVVKDIQEKLHFTQENVFRKSFRRENLTYYVVEEENKMPRMLRIMRKYPASTGIVYVRNRKKTETVAKFLQHEGVSADYYHAGLDSAEREKKQNAWMKGNTKVIVSTNAFGMGIDKPDVRFVIHLDIPDTLEAYFQEAGRGGRDEKPSIAVMLYDQSDVLELKRNLELSFPPLSVIKNIYSKTAQFYGIGLGAVSFESLPFDLHQLSQYCSEKPLTVHHALSFLEKAGCIALSEGVKQPSTMIVKAGGAEIDVFYKNYPALEDFFKTLLRSYSGIYIQYVKINEEELAHRLQLSKEEVVEKLEKLQQIGIIDYKKQNNHATIIFTEERIEEKHLYISPEIYRKRKKVAEKMYQAVMYFIQNRAICRSRLLLQYFGEMKSEPCGACDTCLQIHKKEIQNKEFQEMEKRYEKICLITDNLDIKEIFTQLSVDFPEEKVIAYLRWKKDQASGN